MALNCRKPRKKLLQVLLVCLVGILPTLLFAQSNYNQKVAPLNPEAAGMIKFINTPVDYRTGIPNISIPLYTIEFGGIKMPLTLSYHAGGYRVNEKATWVGMGWKLQGIPEVNRAINGGDDFGFLFDSHSVATGYFENDFLGSNDTTYLDNFSQGRYDESPDEFYYGLLNSSGKIYGNSLMVPLSKTLININRNRSITASEPNGTQYIFGTSPNSTDYSIRSNVSTTTGWKCSKIISPSGRDTVLFTYGNHFNVFNRHKEERIEIIDNAEGVVGNDPWPEKSRGKNCVDEGFYKDLGEWQYYARDACRGNSDIEQNSSRDLFFAEPRMYVYSAEGDSSNRYLLVDSVQRVRIGRANDDGSSTSLSYLSRLQELNVRGIRVVFYSKANALQLDSIHVYNSQNKLVKNIAFSYTPDTREEFPAERNRLDKVTFKDLHNKKTEEYSFQYNGEPYRLGLKTSDRWGFQGKGTRGLEFKGIGIPALTLNVIPYKVATHGYSSEDLNPFDVRIGYELGYNETNEGVKAGVLQRMTLPTGGHIEFGYEVNQYYNYLTGGTDEASGLRIKDIKYFNADQSLQLSKSYKYGENEDGKGLVRPVLYDWGNIRTNMIDYLPSRWNNLDTTNNEIPPHPENGGTERIRVIYGKSLAEMTFPGGAPVLYTKVTEYNENDGHLTGKTEYRYLYDENIFIHNFWPDYGFSFPSKNEWDNGNLSSKTDYAYRNGIFEWINKDTYEYGSHLSPLKLYSAKIVQTKLVVPPNSYQSWEIERMRNFTKAVDSLSSGIRLLKTSTSSQRELATGGIVARKSEFTYNPDLTYQPVKISLGESNGGIRETRVTYNDRELPVQTLQLANTNGNEYVIGGEYREYHPNNTPYKIYSLKAAEPVASGGFNFAPGQDRFELRMKADQISSTDAIDQVQINNATDASYLYSYNGQYPIAEIKGVDYANIENILTRAAIIDFAKRPDVDKTAIDNFLAPLFTALPRVKVTSYTYKPLVGMTSMTDAKGMTTYYEYDGFQRLRYVRDDNGDIVKSYCYNYAGQAVDCNASTAPPLSSDGGSNLTVQRYDTGFSDNRSDFCQQPEPLQQPSSPSGSPQQPSQQVPVEHLPLYSKRALGPVPTAPGQSRGLFYTDQGLTSLAPTGYYSLWETDPAHQGNKVYYIENGEYRFELWCEEAEPAQ